MALLLPCENEIVAHLLRSRLQSHGVECAVVHGGIATVWGGWVMRPRLLIAAEDLEPARALLIEPEVVLDESFIEPVETAHLNENLGFSSTVPDLPAMVAIGLVMGSVALAVATVFTMVAGGMTREVAEQNTALFLPLYGVAAGFAIWPFAWLARSCRLGADGELPLRARFLFLAFLVQNELFWILVYLGQLLFSMLPESLRKLIPGSW